MTDQELFHDFYTMDQVAKLLGITVKTLRNRIGAGKDHPPVVDGRLFLKSEFMKWIQKRQRHQINKAS